MWGRGAAAAATRTFRGDGSRRRHELDILRRLRYVLEEGQRGKRLLTTVSPTRSPAGMSLRTQLALVREAEWISCPLVLTLLCTSRGRHQHSNAAKVSRNGARAARSGRCPQVREVTGKKQPTTRDAKKRHAGKAAPKVENATNATNAAYERALLVVDGYNVLGDKGPGGEDRLTKLWDAGGIEQARAKLVSGCDAVAALVPRGYFSDESRRRRG